MQEIYRAIHNIASYARNYAEDRFGNPFTDQEFVQTILDDGNEFVFSVACSKTDTVDVQWQDLDKAGRMRLIRAANEGILPALVAGVHIGSAGKRKAIMHMQNSGFGYAIDGWIFLESYDLPAAAIVTWRGNDNTEISRPHQEIGRRTGPLTANVALNADNIFGSKDGKGFKRDLRAGLDHRNSGGRSIIRVADLKKTYPMPDEVAPRQLDLVEWMRRQDEIAETRGWSTSKVYSRDPISRQEAHTQVRELHPNAIVVTGNGLDPRDLYDKNHSERNFYQVAYMGSARALAYGMALANPYLTFVALEGDQNTEHGETILHNLAEAYPDNLFCYVLDNGRGSSVGYANSLPLIPDNYRYQRVIRTIPEKPSRPITIKRVEEAIVEYYGIDNDMREIIARVGPLKFLVQRVMDVIRQQTDRKITELPVSSAFGDYRQLFQK